MSSFGSHGTMSSYTGNSGRQWMSLGNSHRENEWGAWLEPVLLEIRRSQRHGNKPEEKHIERKVPIVWRQAYDAFKEIEEPILNLKRALKIAQEFLGDPSLGLI